MNKAMQFLLRGLLMTTMLFAVSAVAQDAHTTGQFQGPKANKGHVTHSTRDGKSVLTLSDDFVVPDTPDPHWQVVDSDGQVYLLDKLKKTPDTDGSTLLDNSLVLYGSPMGDSNIHNHKRVPLLVAGHAVGALKGGVHIKAPDGTPMANPMLTMLHALGRTDLEKFGDSSSELDLNSAAPVVETADAKG